jgi:hypothetical protein
MLMVAAFAAGLCILSLMNESYNSISLDLYYSGPPAGMTNIS